MEDKFKKLMYMQMLKGYVDTVKSSAILCVIMFVIGIGFQTVGLFLLWRAMI